MAGVYGDTSPKYSTAAKWSAVFESGRDSLEDDPKPGRSDDVTSQEVIDHVERPVLKDRWIKVAELASECGISNGSAYTIIDEDLCQKYMPGGYPDTWTCKIVSKGWSQVQSF